MRDISKREPAWFLEKKEEYTELVTKMISDYESTMPKSLVIMGGFVFSEKCHRILVCCHVLDKNKERIFRYDFDTDELMVVSESTSRVFAHPGLDDMKSYDEPVSFVFIRHERGKYPQFEFDVKYLDSMFNNAPNLSNSDIFDTSFENATVCNINDYLYFVHHGKRYLIDGDYNIIAKFPKNLAVSASGYIDDVTCQFILKDKNGFCLYDKNVDSIKLFDIIDVGRSKDGFDFMTMKGDLYIYDKQKGEFVLYKEHPAFIDGMTEVKELLRESNYIRRVVRVYVSIRGQYYIVEGNTVINKECPFDDVRFASDMDSRYDGYVCVKDDIEDIYVGEGKFKYNTLNINNKKIKLWFEQ